MNLNDWLQLNQISLYFFLAALLGLVRERTVLPFIAIAIGAFLKGDVFAILTATLVVWSRARENLPTPFRVKDSVSILLLLIGMAAPAPFREFFTIFGVLGVSYSGGLDRLGVVVALILSRSYFAQPEFMEVVLGTAVGSVVIKESLKALKVKKQELIQKWLEPFLLVGVLLSFRPAVMTIAESEPLVIAGGAILTVLLGIFIWNHFKTPDFEGWLNRIQASSERAFRAIGDRATFGRFWLEKAEREHSGEIAPAYQSIFWWTLIMVVLWVGVVLIEKGGSFEF